MLSRRDLVQCLLAAGCVGCAKNSEPQRRVVKLGAAADFVLAEKRLELFRVLVRRDEGGLYAMSLVCTHQSCVVQAESQGFLCPCHGARFSSRGEVQEGPADRDLPFYELSLKDGEVYLDFSRVVAADWRLSDSA